MKSAEQIGREVIDAHYGIGTDWEEPNKYGEEGFTRAQAESDIDADDVRLLIEEGIKRDRAQRGLIEAVAEALNDRDAHDAAQLVRDTDPDDDLWNNYLGPMLDDLQSDYTRMADELTKSENPCDECDREATNFYPTLAPPVQLCDGCTHDAYRSGWEPGA